jgi:release factor glutamine methyltransferase
LAKLGPGIDFEMISPVRIKDFKVPWTPPQLVKWICDDLKTRGFPTPHRLQAEQLVSHALKLSRLDLYLQHDKPCTEEERSHLRDLLRKRYKREPMAYILGFCEFWSLTLKVGPGVLIPRQETEILVESILSYLPQTETKEPVKILELGTGSAAVPLALCSERDNLNIVTTDYSSEALHYACRNLADHGAIIKQKNNQIIPVQTDRFEAVKPAGGYDFIISNPPYISSEKIASLQAEVAEWEPNSALNGGNSGLDFYEYLVKTTRSFLKPSGYLIFEHGFDQLQSITNITNSEKHLKLLENRKDYSKHDRVMVYQKI